VVPGINTVANVSGAQQTFSIRGVIGAAGAATTSVYLDDTNLTKRNNSGVVLGLPQVIQLNKELGEQPTKTQPAKPQAGGSLAPEKDQPAESAIAMRILELHDRFGGLIK